jgi:hypothetical protein
MVFLGAVKMPEQMVENLPLIYLDMFVNVYFAGFSTYGIKK